MKKILAMVLLIVVAGCGSSGSNNNNSATATLNQIAAQGGGIQFTQNFTLCPGGAVGVTAGQVMSLSQIYQYFGTNYQVFGSNTVLGTDVYAVPQYVNGGLTTVLQTGSQQYTGYDLMFLGAGGSND